MDFYQQARLLYPWLTPQLTDVWVQAMIETGDTNLALAAVRQDASYDDIFPGNRRADGSLRYDEQTYFAVIESFENSLISVGLSPEPFRQNFGGLISESVSPNEFAQRVNSVYERVIDSAPSIRQAYIASRPEFEGVMTDEAILASFLDPTIGEQVLNREITTAEIAAAGFDAGFGLGADVLDLSGELAAFGLNRQGALDLFGAAAEQLPVLSTLAAMDADPDTDFTLENFADALALGDPLQRRRARNLIASTRARFTRTGVARDEEALTGLRPF